MVRWVSIAMFVLLALFDEHTSQTQAAGAPASLTPLSDRELLDSVVPLPLVALQTNAAEPRNRELLQAYYDSIRDWGAILRKRFQVVPGHDDWGYFGRGGHLEDDVRPIAYAAMVQAFLAEADPPDLNLPETDRARMREQAAAALRYLTQSHVTGKGTCLDGKPWGNQWQSAMWARAAGMAGWILWPHLDRSLRLSVARLIEHEADRFPSNPPKSSEFRDTGAEENAWNSQIVALAFNMMPAHPRAARWNEAAKTYMYNTLSLAADRDDHALGDDGRPIRDWVTTVNAHPDCTVENHGLVHVGYLKTSVALLMESAGHYLLSGRPAPGASSHHVPEAMEILYQCAAWDGSPVFFAGNDWKIYHSQAVDVLLYAMVALIDDDAQAARVERVALDWLRKMQKQEEGYYNVRRDLEYGGLCATRLIGCYLAHSVLGAGPEPISQSEFDRRVSGVRQLESGQAILHRTPTKFASFSWGPKRMALALPHQGNWVLWPHFSSYLGTVDGKDSSAQNAKITRFRSHLGDNCFTVAGTLERSAGRLAQDFAYASLVGDVTVYLERLTADAGLSEVARETGTIGHEYDLGTNTREIYGRFGQKQIEGVGSQAEVHDLDTDWLNLGNRVGYVVKRTAGRPNLMRYHDLTQGTGRVPKLQEWFSLIGNREAALEGASEDWACVVTFLNQSSQQTADWIDRIHFEVDGDRAACRIEKDELTVDFGTLDCRIRE